jgi:glycosyltransferase involved in cell wall biosynthesis
MKFQKKKAGTFENRRAEQMKKEHKIAVSGRFLTRRLTGVDRYAIEIMRSLDKIVKPGEFQIVIPTDVELVTRLELKNIEIVHFGKANFFHTNTLFWEQIVFAFYTLKSRRIPLCLCNIAPILRANGFVTVHDIRFSAMPECYVSRREKIVRIWDIINCTFSKLFAKTIFTDSNESKKQLEKYYKIKSERIVITPCSYEHFTREPVNADASAKFGLKTGEYYFAMASVALHKNFKWIVGNAKKFPDKTFAIAGKIDKKEFSYDFELNETENLKFLGYVSDEDAASLMKCSKAFLFPTLYEGFGLPPLEAMSVGAKIIVSDIPVMHEVYGESARYIDPRDYNTDLDELLKMPVAPAEECLNKYSWDKSAEIIYEKIKGIEGENL